jgi:small subunit ribosomal protein S16
MVRIRLRRVGKRKQPFYRVVVADARSPRDGRFIEIIGQYNPLTNPSGITIDNDKALTWLRKGAQPSEQVKSLLKRTGIWTEYVKDKGPGPRKPKRRAPVAQAPAAKPAETPPAKAPAPESTTPEPESTDAAPPEEPSQEAATEAE